MTTRLFLTLFVKLYTTPPCLLLQCFRQWSDQYDIVFTVIINC